MEIPNPEDELDSKIETMMKVLDDEEIPNKQEEPQNEQAEKEKEAEKDEVEQPATKSEAIPQEFEDEILKLKVENKHLLSKYNSQKKKKKKISQFLKDKIVEVKKHEKTIGALTSQMKKLEVEKNGTILALKKTKELKEKSESEVNNLEELLKVILTQCCVKNMKIYVNSSLYDACESRVEQFKLLFNIEDDEEEGEEDDDDDDCPPPLPPPDFDDDFGMEEQEDNFMDSLKFDKHIETEHVKLTKMSKNNLSDSIFKKERIIQKGEKYFSETISREMLRHFQSKATKEKRRRSCSAEALKKKKKEKKKEHLFDAKIGMQTSIILRKIENLDAVIQGIRNSEENIDQGEFEKVFKVFEVVAKIFQRDGIDPIKGIKNKIGKRKPKVFDQYDQQIIELFKIPFLTERMRCLKFRENQKAMIEGLKGDIQKFLDISNSLIDSVEFKDFLSFVLNVSNYLNKSVTDSPKKKKENDQLYEGIDIRSLGNLSKLKSSINKQESLLDLVYRLIAYKSPKILTFADQLADTSKIAGVKIQFLQDTFKEIKAEISYLIRAVKMFQKNKKKFDKKEYKKLSSFEELIPTCNFEIIEIKKMFSDLNDVFNSIGELYAQDTSQMDHFFIDLADFLAEFKKAKMTYQKNKKKYTYDSPSKDKNKENKKKKTGAISEEERKFQKIKHSKGISMLFNSFARSNNKTIKFNKSIILEKIKKKKKKREKKKRMEMEEILKGHTKKIDLFMKLHVKIDKEKEYTKLETLIIGKNIFIFGEDNVNTNVPIDKLKSVKSHAKKCLIRLRSKSHIIKLFFEKDKDFKNFLSIIKKVRGDCSAPNNFAPMK